MTTHFDLLIGIDDTDNLDSKGTGFLSQRLLAELEAQGLGRALGVTRHQLYVHPDIPYTSHNSSACIAWDGGPDPDVAGVIAAAGHFLQAESAPGSDPGLVVATRRACADPAVTEALAIFGRRAKREVLSLSRAWELARNLGVHASGHGGTSGGIIGALAGVGLHLSGTDGLFLWMPGIRALTGFTTYRELKESVPIDAARDPAGIEPEPEDTIDLGDWVRPVLSGGRAVLLLEPRSIPIHDSTGSADSMGSAGTGDPAEPAAPEGRTGRTWGVAPKEIVKVH